MKKTLLNDEVVSGRPPADGGRRDYLYDEEVPGFGVAVTAKGTKTFFLYRKIKGVPKRITIGHFPGMSVEAARQVAREHGTAIEKTGDEPKALAKPVHDARRRTFYLGLGAAAAAACLAVLVLAGAGIVSFWKSEAALQSLITFAIDDHLNHRDISIRSEDPRELRQALARVLPLEVEIPRIEPGFRVVGGRPEKIGANSVAYTVWSGKNNSPYSLLQFRRVDFGVNPADRPQLVTPEDMAVKHTPCQALYWSRGDYGFVLVADHGELLDGVGPPSN